jgi:hypothetical protein
MRIFLGKRNEEKNGGPSQRASRTSCYQSSTGKVLEAENGSAVEKTRLQPERQTGRSGGRQADKQTDKQTGRQADSGTDGDTHRTRWRQAMANGKTEYAIGLLCVGISADTLK